LTDREAFLAAVLDLDPAVLHCPVPPFSRAFVHAFTYAQAHLVPMLLRIWPLPDDLPHAAGSGDFARVRRWFDAAGRPALGDLANHFPSNDDWIRGNLGWGAPREQQVLDTALAWAVMNNHLEIADFLLGHGADVNTNWCSHEAASILHELVWHKNYDAMQFLIDHGIDMTIRDYRWGATALGWAAVARPRTRSLYPVLHRLDKAGFIDAERTVTPNGPRARVYRLTKPGRKRLKEIEESWTTLTEGVRRVLRWA